MTPVTALVGKWVAKVGDKIVATGDSYEEVIKETQKAGYGDEEFVVERVAETGGFVL